MMSRSFLNRPFWRDWVLGGVMIGVGFMIYAPRHPVINGAGVALVLAGAAIYLAALTHAVCGVFSVNGARLRRRRRSTVEDDRERRRPTR